MKLQSDYPALVISDNFTGQGTENVLELLENNNIHIVIVAANCTDRLQPLDLSVNKPAKNFLRQPVVCQSRMPASSTENNWHAS